MADVCSWVQEDDEWGYYETDCGETFVMIDGTPADNSMKYCCYCGKQLVGKPFDPEAGSE